jgi:hypothetical protein
MHAARPIVETARVAAHFVRLFIGAVLGLGFWAPDPTADQGRPSVSRPAAAALAGVTDVTSDLCGDQQEHCFAPQA